MAVPAAVLAADEMPSFVMASSQLDETVNPQTYSAVNLIDSDDKTLWCSSGNTQGEHVQIVFNKELRVDTLIVVPAATGTGIPIKSVRLSDGGHSVVVPLNGERTEQPLGHTLQGRSFTISIEKLDTTAARSANASDSACLADIVLAYGTHQYAGDKTAARLMREDLRRKVIGRWLGSPLGAPESYLTFAIDGTWEWTYEPLMGGKQQKLAGEYRFRGDHLLMRQANGTWIDVGFRLNRVNVDTDEMGAPLSDYDIMSINESLGKKLAGTYNNARF